jgi:P27 family predicted phage terminase small subunit
MTKPLRPPAPPHLSDASRAWWKSVLETYELEQHHRRLLQLAAEAWDGAQAAREALATHGMTYTDRHGQPHLRPEAALERDHRTAFARLIRELDLDVAAPSSTRIGPPPLRSNRGRA